MQLTAAGDPELVGVGGLLDPQGHVVQHLALQPLAQLPARDVFALFAGERRRIGLECHRDRRFIDSELRQCLDMLRVAERCRDSGRFNATERDNVARHRRLHLDSVKTFESQDLQHALLAHGSISIDHRNLLIALQRTPGDAADANRAHVARIVESRDLQLKGSVRVYRRQRHVLHNGLEKGLHVGADLIGFESGKSLKRRSVDHREVELFVGRTQPVEQVERLIEHPIRSSRFAIDLVDDNDRVETVGKRLACYIPRLRHRAFDRIDKKKHGVDHRQNALDFTTEVGMARGIDDIDPIAVPADRGVLRENRDAPLPLQIVRVENPVRHRGAGIERTRLLEQLVDERRLAVIDMRDDRDVT